MNCFEKYGEQLTRNIIAFGGKDVLTIEAADKDDLKTVARIEEFKRLTQELKEECIKTYMTEYFQKQFPNIIFNKE